MTAKKHQKRIQKQNKTMPRQMVAVLSPKEAMEMQAANLEVEKLRKIGLAIFN